MVIFTVNVLASVLFCWNIQVRNPCNYIIWDAGKLFSLRSYIYMYMWCLKQICPTIHDELDTQTSVNLHVHYWLAQQRAITHVKMLGWQNYLFTITFTSMWELETCQPYQEGGNQHIKRHRVTSHLIKRDITHVKLGLWIKKKFFYYGHLHISVWKFETNLSYNDCGVTVESPLSYITV